MADTSTSNISPPSDSTITSCANSSFLTLFGSAPSRSILFIATIIGTLASFEWLIASIVCGITPSFAATTITTISVTLAPLDRIDVNAACPGVSINVIVFFLGVLSWYAPMCWVIPPASPETILVSLSASSKLVFPWSTCPIIVTTGYLGCKSSSLSSIPSRPSSTSDSDTLFTL